MATPAPRAAQDCHVKPDTSNAPDGSKRSLHTRPGISMLVSHAGVLLGGPESRR